MSGPKVRFGTQEKIYNQHLVNLKKVTTKTDDKAPRLPIRVYMKAANFYGDIVRLKAVERQNRDLLKMINTIYRTKGRVDCHLERYSRRKTTFFEQDRLLQRQQKKNEDFLNGLKKVKSAYNQEDSLKDWKKILKKMKHSAKYPEFYEKKRHLHLWSICSSRIISDPKTHQICYMDFKIGNLPKTFRLEIELYNDIVPGTADNFANLCRGFKGLCYKDTPLHRIVPGLFCIGGDVVNRSGTGGMSIYGPSFPDENFLLNHNGPGVVAMYSSEPDRNNSQFLITFRRLSTLNGRYVVVGAVKSSLNTLDLIESCGTKGGKPLQHVKVEACGVYE